MGGARWGRLLPWVRLLEEAEGVAGDGEVAAVAAAAAASVEPLAEPLAETSLPSAAEAAAAAAATFRAWEAAAEHTWFALTDSARHVIEFQFKK